MRQADRNGHSCGGHLLPLHVHPVNTWNRWLPQAAPALLGVWIVRAEAERTFVVLKQGLPSDPVMAP